MKPFRSPERVMVIGCSHGDMADAEAVTMAMKWCKHFKPHVRVHLGDAIDASPWRARASLSDKVKGFRTDLCASAELLAEYRPTHYLLGNHEDRIVRDSESLVGVDAEIARAALDEAIEACGHSCKVYPYDSEKGVLRIDDTNLIHGYEHNKHAVYSSGLGYSRVVMAHLHRVERIRIDQIGRPESRCIGCLCRLDMRYSQAQRGKLRQDHGFAYGYRHKGRLFLWQAEKDRGEWLFPSEVMTHA